MSTATQKTFTVEKLKESEEFKRYIGSSDVVKIHDVYYDVRDDYATFIVITKKSDLFNITRFFPRFGGDMRMGVSGRLNVSVDHEKITAEKVFDVLLEDYSS